MQRVECYIPLQFAYSDVDSPNPEAHMADIITQEDFEKVVAGD